MTHSKDTKKQKVQAKDARRGSSLVEAFQGAEGDLQEPREQSMEELQAILQAAMQRPPISWEEALGDDFHLISVEEDPVEQTVEAKRKKRETGKPKEIPVDTLQELLKLPITPPEEMDTLIKEAAERVRAHGWVLPRSSSIK